MSHKKPITGGKKLIISFEKTEFHIPNQSAFVFSSCLKLLRYNSVYLTCSKKLTGSQLSLLHGIYQKLKCETKNKMMSVIGPVQSRYREAVQ